MKLPAHISSGLFRGLLSLRDKTHDALDNPEGEYHATQSQKDRSERGYVATNSGGKVANKRRRKCNHLFLFLWLTTIAKIPNIGIS